MKIGLLVDDTLDKPDGVQQYVLAVGRWLSSQGHEVHYLAAQTQRTDIPNIHSLSKNVAVRFNGNRLTIPLPVSRRAIRRIVDELSLDVLHVQMPHSPLFAQRVIRALPQNVAVIGTFHILPHSPFVGWLTSLLGLWLRPSLRRIDTVLAVSTAAKSFADNSFRIVSRVLPNAIDLSPFFAAKPQAHDIPTIVYLNRLEPRKGCIYLLRAVETLIKEDPSRQLRVVACGKGSESATLLKFVVDHQLSGYVTFEGFIAEDQKPRYLATADITVYPSTGGESFGIVLLEGMAAGYGVVVAGDNPGYRSVLGAFPDQLFDPRDNDAFTGCLRRFLDDEPERRVRSKAQREYAKKFDISSVGPELVRLYEEALHRCRKSDIL